MSTAISETSLTHLQARTRPLQRLRGDHPFFAFFACAAILLPAHPSLQSFFLTHGVPSPLVSAAFSLPLLYFSLTRRTLTRQSLSILFLFVVFICWMFARAIFSPAFGEPNFLASIRGTMLLVPLSLFCALIAARNPECAAKTIFVVGFIAIAHFSGLTLFGGTSSEPTGFRSLAADPDKQNYQSTSFYFGLAGVVMMCIALRQRGMRSLLGLLGTFFTVALMGTVGARAALVALTISTFAIIATSHFGRLVRILTLAVPTFVLLGIVAWTSGIIDLETVRRQLVVIDRFVVLIEDDDSSQRVRLFASAIAMWLDSPTNFLVGGGLGAFPQFIGESADEGWYPHNFILESLAEGGLVAGLLLAPIGLRLLIEFFKLKSNTSDIVNIYLGALAFYAVAAYQVMGGLQTLWIPTFFVALFLFSNSHNKA